MDQFANLVLHRCIERIHVGQEFGDIPRGVFIVRGENVVSCRVWHGRSPYFYIIKRNSLAPDKTVLKDQTSHVTELKH